MALTPQQLQALKADIASDPALASKPMTSGAALEIAAAYNAAASPAFKVWRSSVSRTEIYNKTSDDGTTWSWTFYKSQSVVEQNAWTQMFMGDQADFSQANLRAGIAVIFTAASAVNAAHALAIGKRSATRAEKLFSTGAGSAGSPATMGFEGSITSEQVQQARELP